MVRNAVNFHDLLRMNPDFALPRAGTGTGVATVADIEIKPRHTVSFV
jgi:hypothetical protein